MDSRGIIFETSPKSAKTLRNIWKTKFAGDLTSEDKKRIYINAYIWHIFSYELKEALSNKRARQAFNKKRKKHVYVFYQNKEEVFYIEDAENLKSSDFDKEQDVFILDTEIQWTYVHTHEAQCGPYFVQISKA